MKKQKIVQWSLAVLMIFILLCAVNTIGSGFKLATAGRAKELFQFVSNPFSGLIVGTLCTALIQSSSTVTSIIVGLVAGGLPLNLAVPLIMGANIGTSITNTIISVGYYTKKKEYRRAFEAATVHDIFNLLIVAIFLPLELLTHFLTRSGEFLSHLLTDNIGNISIKDFNFLKQLTKPVTNVVKHYAAVLFSTPYDGIATVAVGIVCVFFSILVLGKLLKSLMRGRAKEMFRYTLGNGKLRGILSGTALTVAVQSSSTSTSFIIPFAAEDIVSLEEVYPYTLGANIGTTITAFLAATSLTADQNQFAGMAIACIHVLFNVFGVLLVANVPVLYNIPLKSAKLLGRGLGKSKVIPILYILCVFFFIPATLLAITK